MQVLLMAMMTMYLSSNYCQLGFSWLHLLMWSLLLWLLPTSLECASYWEHAIVLTLAAFSCENFKMWNAFNSEIFILRNEIFLKIQYFLSLKKNYGFFWGENYNIFENYIIINVEVARVVGYLVRVFRSFSAQANTMSITCVKQF
jgi:hypothetical protein